MKSVATIKLKIPNNKLLLDTMKQYSKAISYIADKGFASGIHNRYKLHHLCYYEARNKFNLPSQFVINANRIASQTLKSVKANKGRGFNFWLHGWSFYQLQSFISYKAMWEGVNVLKVNPYHTSQTCSKCGSLGSRSKGFFVCSHCGYSFNADLNASLNLAKHHSMSDGVPLRDAGNPGFPSISVAVTQPHIQSDDVKGIFCATAAELMDKSPHL